MEEQTRFRVPVCTHQIEHHRLFATPGIRVHHVKVIETKSELAVRRHALTNRPESSIAGCRPPSIARRQEAPCDEPCPRLVPFGQTTSDGDRSEERRVGKECRSRWSP